MVQILPPAESFSTLFARELGGGFAKGAGKGYESHQKRKAYEKMGIDPRVADLPEDVQAAYFKQQFASPKEMTDLQRAQEELARAKIGQIEGQQKFFDQIVNPQGDISLPSEDFNQPNQYFNETDKEPSKGGFDIKKLPENKLKALAGFKGQPGQPGIYGNIAQAELDRRSEEKKVSFEKEKLARHEETEISKPILIELNQMRKNIPLQEQAIVDIQEAAPNVSALDYFADITGFEPLRSAEGAKLKTGIKDFFLSDLTRVGARPNQWIEQQLADALPKIGRSAEANLITAEGLKFKLDLAKKRIETIDKLAEQDREKFGFVKGDIDSRAYDEIKKFAINRQKQLQDNIKKIKAQNKGEKSKVVMISPEGSTYEILSDDIDEALENGFEFTK